MGSQERVAGYRRDLAYIHDSGFGGYAAGAAPGLLTLLRGHGIRGGLVVDLGCGSGGWARALVHAGYDVLGIDLSPDMIALARKKAPRASFRTGSLLTGELPPCVAATSIGECLNYLFDHRKGKAGLRRYFRRIHGALAPGGLFIFDFATPERAPASVSERKWLEGPDWAILVEISGSRPRRRLERRIVTFRKSGGAYRSSEELHRLELFNPDELSAELERAGFAVRPLASYGRFPLLPGTAALLAKKD